MSPPPPSDPFHVWEKLLCSDRSEAGLDSFPGVAQGRKEEGGGRGGRQGNFLAAAFEQEASPPPLGRSRGESGAKFIKVHFLSLRCFFGSKFRTYHNTQTIFIVLLVILTPTRVRVESPSGQSLSFPKLCPPPRKGGKKKRRERDKTRRMPPPQTERTRRPSLPFHLAREIEKLHSRRNLCVTSTASFTASIFFLRKLT